MEPRTAPSPAPHAIRRPRPFALADFVLPMAWTNSAIHLPDLKHSGRSRENDPAVWPTPGEAALVSKLGIARPQAPTSRAEHLDPLSRVSTRTTTPSLWAAPGPRNGRYSRFPAGRTARMPARVNTPHLPAHDARAKPAAATTRKARAPSAVATASARARAAPPAVERSATHTARVTPDAPRTRAKRAPDPAQATHTQARASSFGAGNPAAYTARVIPTAPTTRTECTSSAGAAEHMHARAAVFAKGRPVTRNVRIIPAAPTTRAERAAPAAPAGNAHARSVSFALGHRPALPALAACNARDPDPPLRTPHSPPHGPPSQPSASPDMRTVLATCAAHPRDEPNVPGNPPSPQTIAHLGPLDLDACGLAGPLSSRIYSRGSRVPVRVRGELRSVWVPPGLTFPNFEMNLLASIFPHLSWESLLNCGVVYKGLPRNHSACSIQLLRRLRTHEQPNCWTELDRLIYQGGELEVSLPMRGGGDFSDSPRSDAAESDQDGTQQEDDTAGSGQVGAQPGDDTTGSDQGGAQSGAAPPSGLAVVNQALQNYTPPPYNELNLTRWNYIDTWLAKFSHGNRAYSLPGRGSSPSSTPLHQIDGQARVLAAAQRH